MINHMLRNAAIFIRRDRTGCESVFFLYVSKFITNPAIVMSSMKIC